MFFWNVIKKNKHSSKVYEYQQLVESVRVEKGSRQTLLLNLGKLPIAKDKWPRLAERIESIIKAQQQLLSEESIIENHAVHFAEQVIQNNLHPYNGEANQYESVNINSLNNYKIRQIGAEYISYSYFRQLELDHCLKTCKFNQQLLRRLCPDESEGKIHELNILKKLSLDPGTIIVFDRGLIDYSQMGKWIKQGVYWVTLLKKNADYKVVKSRMALNILDTMLQFINMYWKN